MDVPFGAILTRQNRVGDLGQKHGFGAGDGELLGVTVGVIEGVGVEEGSVLGKIRVTDGVGNGVIVTLGKGVTVGVGVGVGVGVLEGAIITVVGTGDPPHEAGQRPEP